MNLSLGPYLGHGKTHWVTARRDEYLATEGL